MLPRYQVKVTRLAEKDVHSIFEHIAQNAPYAAKRWVEEIDRQIDSLTHFPSRAPIIPEAEEIRKEYRHLFYGDYRTIFRILGRSVIIVRVIHGARLLQFIDEPSVAP